MTSPSYLRSNALAPAVKPLDLTDQIFASAAASCFAARRRHIPFGLFAAGDEGGDPALFLFGLLFQRLRLGTRARPYPRAGARFFSRMPSISSCRVRDRAARLFV